MKHTKTVMFSLLCSVFLVYSLLQTGSFAFAAKKNAQKTKEEKKRKETERKKKQKKKKRQTKQKKKEKKRVYLTFDDGPSGNTDEILKILNQYGIKGTFFVIGREDDASLKRYKAIVEAGHTIGLHSYTHNYRQIYANLKAFKKDYKRISDLIYKATGVRSHYYRFPGGSSNTISPTHMSVFADYLKEKGVKYFDWNIQCGDAVKKIPSPYTLYKNTITPISKSGLSSFIVLIHDSKPMKNSKEALPLIIEWLQENNYEILPIDDETEPIHHNFAKK